MGITQKCIQICNCRKQCNKVKEKDEEQQTEEHENKEQHDKVKCCRIEDDLLFDALLEDKLAKNCQKLVENILPGSHLKF